MEGQKQFAEPKSPERLQQQVNEVNVLRAKDGRELIYPNPEDFTLPEPELKAKYGKEYDEFRADLKLVISAKIDAAESVEEVDALAKEVLGANTHATKQYQEAVQKGSPDVSTRKQLLQGLSISVGTLAFLGILSWGGLEQLGKKNHAEMMKAGVGKRNAILAAQSADGLIFKGDKTIEQVLMLPASASKENEIKKAEAEEDLKKGEISPDEYRKELWEIENTKVQGFVDAYERKFVTFEEFVDNIRKKGEEGILTTLNFGDSSTSGWNSDILTDNAIAVAREIFPELRKHDASLPESFDAWVQSNHPHDYDSRMYVQTLGREAQKLKSDPLYQQLAPKEWDRMRRVVKSPLLNYDTYSDKLAKIDQAHHYVNLGVPGYSSVHAAAYIRRMLDKFEEAGVAGYIDSATLYFGNNDSVNNGNAEDKFYIGDDAETQKHYHALRFLHEEVLPNLFNTTRVNKADFRANLTDAVRLLKEKGIKNITLFVPVVPLDWTPGKRAANDAQEVVDQQLEKGGKLSRELNEATDKYADYVYERGHIEESWERDYNKARELGEEALEHDFVVPRRKKAYAKAIAEVARAEGVGLVNLESVLPIEDMSHQNTSSRNPSNITNDYCHPVEHPNILLALAQAHIANRGNGDYKEKALQELIKLGVSEAIARKEVEEVLSKGVATKDQRQKYGELSSAVRTRPTWNNEKF